MYHQRNYSYASPPTPTITTTTNSVVNFSGIAIETTVTNAVSSVDAWLSSVHSPYLAAPTIVGLDCEWRPNYARGQCNRVATLQLCIGNRCLIVQLFHMTLIPQSLKNFISDGNITFVGIGIGADVAKLANDYWIRCRKWSDLDGYCKAYLGVFQRMGLKGYAQAILGLVMEKPKRVSMSNWESRVLSEEQVKYGCIDAYVSYRLGAKVLLGY